MSFFLQWSGLRFTYDPERAVLFNIPLPASPLPSFHAVLKAEAYSREGLQTAGNEDYLPLDPEQLYCVATDSYILSYLPMAGEMLPMLKIVPQRQHGGEPGRKSR